MNSDVTKTVGEWFKDVQPCGFCGSKLVNVVIFKAGTVRVTCTECLASGPIVTFDHANTLEKVCAHAIAKWNNRKPVTEGYLQ